MSEWPPTYTLNKSSRAKRFSIKICPYRGLQIVMPKNASESAAIDFLEQHKSWVQKHQHLIPESEQEPLLPDQINLIGLDQQLPIRYLSISNSGSLSLYKKEDEILIYGKTEDEPACVQILKKWVMQRAKRFLRAEIDRLSISCKLPYNKLSIRGQKTRWGSCGSDKNISLNYHLIFLPQHLIEYVIIHELCHTIHLNHSNNFWQLVGQHFPNYRSAKKQLKNSSDFIPKWIMLNA